MIYLDTHVLVWLHAGLVERFSKCAHALINDNDIYISAVVSLELQYFYEIKKIKSSAREIVTDLSERIGVDICTQSFSLIISGAMKMNWTRDPFDRIITANAGIDQNILLTKDRNIAEHYAHAVW